MHMYIYISCIHMYRYTEYIYICIDNTRVQRAERRCKRANARHLRRVM